MTAFKKTKNRGKKILYCKYVRTLRGHFPSSALAWRLSFILSFAASNKSINFTVSEDLIEESREVKDRSGKKEEEKVGIEVEVREGEKGNEGEFSDTEFSDWDEEEDTENEHVNRRGTSYPSDDLSVLQDELDMLERYFNIL